MKTWEVRHKRFMSWESNVRAKSRLGAIRQVMRRHNRRFECNTTERGWVAVEIKDDRLGAIRQVMRRHSGEVR